MKHARLPSLLCASLLTVVLAVSCSSTHDTADVIPSSRGAVQPDGGGKLIDEARACSGLVKAESDARARLGCDAVKRDCPAAIRPAGGADCYEYDEASLDGCAALYASFTSCVQFDQEPCLLRAVSKCDTVDSGMTDAGGAGGQTGQGGAGGGGGEASLPSGLGGATSAGAGAGGT